jgi:transcriptional regulator with XRE-family HTH domain
MSGGLIMVRKSFPVIDVVSTGRNILRLRREKGYSVHDLQAYFGFESPQAIYKWQRGESLPSVDNLYALSCLFGCSMNDILIEVNRRKNINGQFASTDCPFDFLRVRRHFIPYAILKSMFLKYI